MGRNTLTIMMAGCSVIALSTAALAQETDADEAETTLAQAAPTETLVVTGSRIVRNGYQAPTPVTVVSTNELAQGAPTNIADGLRQLPQFAKSNGQTGGGTTGELWLTNVNPPPTGNFLNLRGLGPQRMLVLIDGRRVPPTSFEGTVDTNIIPQALAERVDVVTAGASAVYGADAVSGVVNYILDTDYTGLKGLVQGGTSEYGDADNVRGSIAGGLPFANGRGHLLASAEYYRNSGVKHRYDRPYLNEADNPWFLGGTGTQADPYRILRGVRNIRYTPGGIITNTYNAAGGNNNTAADAAGLLNLHFLTDQITAPFVFGAPTGNSGVRIGGDGSTGTPMGAGASTLRTSQGFARASYELTPSVTAFVQGSAAESRTTYTGNYDSRGGTAALRIFSGNAYLPDHIQQLMDDTGTESFQFSRQELDFPGYETDILNNAFSVTAGLEGDFALFDTDWNWDFYYTHGEARMRAKQLQVENRRLFAAADAVVDPISGDVVCRVDITDPTLLPGCVPVNLFGDGTPSLEAIDYLTDFSTYMVFNDIDEFAGNIGGSPFSTWAGPVSINIGASYREQSLRQESNADPAVPTDFGNIRGVTGNRARFGFTNTGTAQGSYSATEAYAEAVVPLLADAPLAELLEVNGAIRYTDYSTSGGIDTWKVGVSYQPIPDLRFRATRSKDIRAPTLYDLYAGRDLGLTDFTDVGVTGLSQIYTQYTGGNPDLKPEISHTTSFGLIYQPSFVPGLSASIDYYDVSIEDAISNISSTAAHNDCVISGGTSPLCDLFDRPFGNLDPDPANFPISFFATSVNIASLKTNGVDLDVTYATDLEDFNEALVGRLGLRALFNYVPEYATNAGAGAPTFDQAGIVGRSEWNGLVSANYDVGPLGLFVQARYVGPAKRDTPENTGFFYLENDYPSQTYFDLSVNYDIEVGGRSFTPFFTINNVENREALIVPTTFLPNVPVPTVSAYDYIGRRYTAGIRFEF